MCLETFDTSLMIIALQEHNRIGFGLGTLQGQIRDCGCDGVWTDAILSESQQGATGGVAVQAKTSIPITAPPCCCLRLRLFQVERLRCMRVGCHGRGGGS